MGRRQLDLVGQRFGWLTVKEKVPKRIEDVRTTFICECSCGGIITVTGGNLKSGNTTSCGCKLHMLLRSRKTYGGKLK